MGLPPCPRWPDDDTIACGTGLKPNGDSVCFYPHCEAAETSRDERNEYNPNPDRPN